MGTVDGLCQRRYGLSIYDLPDCCFRDWFDEGMTPGEAVSLARESAE
jgi:hypothetical protein